MKQFLLETREKSAKLWLKIGQNYGLSSDLKASKIGSKLWVHRQITKNYGSEQKKKVEKHKRLCFQRGGVLTHNLYLQLKIGPKFLVDEKSSKIELYRLIMIFFFDNFRSINQTS